MLSSPLYALFLFIPERQHEYGMMLFKEDIDGTCSGT